MARKKTKTALALIAMEKEYKAYNAVRPKVFTGKVSSIRVNRQEARIRALENGDLPDERLNTINKGDGYTNLNSPTRFNGMHC